MTEEEREPDYPTLGLQEMDLAAGSGPAWLFPLLGGLVWGAVMLALIMERL